MSYYRNLVPGQWQIDDIVMGRGTNIRIEDFDVKPYDINAQDYQVARADEIRFGYDSHKPTTLELTLEVLHNRMLPGYEYLKPNFWHSMPSLSDLQQSWRGDDVRNIYGQMKPLYYCSNLDEIPKIILGRPGQFGITGSDTYSLGETVKCVAEFRRGDTYAYSIYQNAIFMNSTTLLSQINGSGGTGPSWLSIFIAGPVDHPIVTLDNMMIGSGQIGSVTIELDYDIEDGEIVEINGEPWARRVVNNADPALSLPAKLVGGSPYLDRLRFNFNSTVHLEFSGGSMTSGTGVAVLWRDSYQVL